MKGFKEYEKREMIWLKYCAEIALQEYLSLAKMQSAPRKNASFAYPVSLRDDYLLFSLSH